MPLTGDAVRRLRRIANMTQEQFALLLGTAPSTVQQWEANPPTVPTGHHARSLVMLDELSRHVRPAQVFGGMTVTFWDAIKRILQRDPAQAFALCWREWLEVPGGAAGHGV